jgi:hypothetical protein
VEAARQEARAAQERAEQTHGRAGTRARRQPTIHRAASRPTRPGPR